MGTGTHVLHFTDAETSTYMYRHMQYQQPPWRLAMAARRNIVNKWQVAASVDATWLYLALGRGPP